jgi:hypothetical protein
VYYYIRICAAVLVAAVCAAVCYFLAGDKDTADFLLHLTTSVGVFFAVVFALYGPKMSRLASRVDLRIQSPDREDSFFNGPEGVGRNYCHHLLVKNLSPAEPVKNCRVWLVEIRDGPDLNGNFASSTTFAVPRLMSWAPAEYSPDKRDFSEDQVLDFGKTFVNAGFFNMDFVQGGEFNPRCDVGKTRRYVLRITADNYLEAPPITVEVSVRVVEPSQDWPATTRSNVSVVSQNIDPIYITD